MRWCTGCTTTCEWPSTSSTRCTPRCGTSSAEQQRARSRRADGGGGADCQATKRDDACGYTVDHLPAKYGRTAISAEMAAGAESRANMLTYIDSVPLDASKSPAKSHRICQDRCNTEFFSFSSKSCFNKQLLTA